MKRGIQQLFSEVPARYELINHVLTFGMDILWRNKAVSFVKPDHVTRVMDLCTGTGETAFLLRSILPENVQVYSVDFSKPMLSKSLEKKDSNKIMHSLADVGKLPFNDGSFDYLTISFATRNINLNRKVLSETFKEFSRVLKKGGIFINLETSQPNSKLYRSMFHGYVKTVVKPVGHVISKSADAYRYLSSTIPRFYPAEELKSILLESGFESVVYTKLMGGIAAIHQAEK